LEDLTLILTGTSDRACHLDSMTIVGIANWT